MQKDKVAFTHTHTHTHSVTQHSVSERESEQSVLPLSPVTSAINMLQLRSQKHATRNGVRASPFSSLCVHFASLAFVSCGDEALRFLLVALHHCLIDRAAHRESD
jgi:hypothetical protein